MDAQYKSDLHRVLSQQRPERVLCVGRACGELLGDYFRDHPDSTLQQLTAGDAARQLENAGVFDLIVVRDTLEQMAKADALHLLARLRDRHGGHLALLLPLGGRPGHASHWNSNELLAMGLLQLGTYDDTDGEYGLFSFDIERYKSTPDWLNSRYWAHPERWDKEFW